MKHVARAVMMVIIALFQVPAFAPAVELTNPSEVRANQRSEITYFPVLRLQEKFEYPINREFSRKKTESPGDSIVKVAPKEEPPFVIDSNESLAHVLDRLTEKEGDTLQWRTTNQHTCVFIKDPAFEDETDQDNLMERRISVNVESVTAWDALKSIATQINTSSATHRPFLIAPTGYDVKSTYRPKAEFYEARSITLALSDVTVREAVCAIFNQSELRLSYGYTPSPVGVEDATDWLQIDFVRNLREIDDPTSFEESKKWSKELQSMRDEFANAHKK